MLYTSFKEMKDSKLNKPFDEKKHKKYIESLNQFHKLDKKLVKVNNK